MLLKLKDVEKLTRRQMVEALGSDPGLKRLKLAEVVYRECRRRVGVRDVVEGMVLQYRQNLRDRVLKSKSRRST